MNQSISSPLTQANPRRGDIQGVRAIGIVLIAIFHIWVGKVSGGVDVLFVISGFLMMGVILRDYEKSGRIFFFKFWGRIALRILPSALLIIFIVFIAGTWIIPISQWLSFANHAIASILQIENLHLMVSSTDYLARAEPPSPFQHFWALSIQMQFFVFLPFLMLGLVTACRLFEREHARERFMSVALLLLSVASFVYSLHIIGLSPSAAYFDPLGRLWEFLVGVISALNINKVRISKAMRLAIGWTGLAILITCGFVLPINWHYPGAVAFVPVLAAVLLLVAGHQRENGDAAGFLSQPLLHTIGNFSFSIYLWHWPLLIFGMEVFDTTHLNFVQGLAVVVLSVILAYLTYLYIEQPMRKLGGSTSVFMRPDWFKAAFPFAVCLVLALPVAASVWGWKQLQERRAQDYLSNRVISSPAKRLTDIQETADAGLQHQLVASARAALDSTGCNQTIQNPEVLVCAFGSDKRTAAVIALVGGSHTLHWQSAFREIASRHDLKVLNITKSACPLGGGETADPSCAEWQNAVVQELVRLKPDLVFTTATRPNVEGHGDIVPESYKIAWKRITDKGLRITAIRDNPWMRLRGADCAARHGSALATCGVARSAVLSDENPMATFQGISNVSTVDLSDYFCTEYFCPAVNNGILMYSDNNHITSQFAKVLSWPLEEALLKTVPKMSR